MRTSLLSIILALTAFGLRAADFIAGVTITNNATRTTGFNPVYVGGSESAGFVFKFQGDTTNTGALTLTFGRSTDGVNIETAPRFTFASALNSNTVVVAYTNWGREIIGGAQYVHLISIQNADSAGKATNATVSLVPKKPN